MPQHIDVPGMGVVEFPDGMSDDQIATAIKQNMSPQPSTSYSGSILPFSKDASGVHFDSNAGVLGMVKNLLGGAKDAALLPGRVIQEAQQPKASISDSDVSILSVPSALNFAAMTGPVNPAIQAGDKAIPGISNTLVPAKPLVPSATALKEAGAADINAAKQSGLEIRPSAVAEMSRKAQQDLFDSGIHPIDAPGTYTKLKELENAPAGSIFTAANLQSLRESLGTTAQNFNPNAAKDQLAASRTIKQLDGLLPSLDPKDVVAGTPAATAKLFDRGHGNYAAAMRSNSLTGELDRANTGILERAEARAQASNSGRNIDNTIRQKIASLLEKPKEVSGFSETELAALNQSLEGGAGRNAARYIGNVLGGGGGLGQMLTSSIGAGAGAVAGGPVGAAVGAGIPLVGGAAAKTIANILAKKSLRQVDEVVRSNSPMYREIVNSTPMLATNLNKRAMVAKAILMAALRQGQPQQ